MAMDIAPHAVSVGIKVELIEYRVIRRYIINLNNFVLEFSAIKSHLRWTDD